MRLQGLDDLLIDQVKDLYSAEVQLVKILQRLMKRAANESLKMSIEGHLSDTERHVDRLENIGSKLDIKVGGKKCRAMEGLIEEARDTVTVDGSRHVIDAAIVAALQRIEHYEISAYGTARALAAQLGYDDVVKLLQETLEEESAVDERLSQISLDELLPAAAANEDDDEEAQLERIRSDELANQ